MLWTFIKLSWKNLFRNKRRSFIAGLAIGVGLASLIFVDALIIGMRRNMIASATASFLGEAQIHTKDYRKTREASDVVNRGMEVLDELGKEEVVDHFAPRVMAFAMITSAANMSSVSLIGVDPGREKHVSQVDEALVEGTYFEGEGERQIIIGRKLAEILEVALGDRVVITVAQAESGDLSQEMFRVSGITFFNIQDMDRGTAFVRWTKAQEMLGIGRGFHEIAVTFKPEQYARNENAPFWEKYSRYGNEAAGWPELMPQMNAALELSQFSTFIVGGILFGVVALGIINTLFMSLHERMFEFGVLRAVGTRSFQMGGMILLEAGALALLSIGLGLVLGLIICLITAETGLDYTGIEFAGVTFRKMIYPVLEVSQFYVYPFWVMVFTLVAGIYPAVHAGRLKPAEAMRKSL